MPQQKALGRKYFTQVRWKGLGRSAAMNPQLNVSLSQCFSIAAWEDLACFFSSASLWTGILERAGISMSRFLWHYQQNTLQKNRLSRKWIYEIITPSRRLEGDHCKCIQGGKRQCPVWLQQYESLLPCAFMLGIIFPLVVTWMLIFQTCNPVF